MKQNSQRKITLYYMARLIGIAWNKAAFMNVDVSVVESHGHLFFEPQQSA
jgi:hypothetical protein